MTESIQFKGVFLLNSAQEHTIITPTGKKWHIEDLWLVEKDEVIQKLYISNDDVESYYYADSEVSYGENSANKIRKSVRMISSNIWFKIYRYEYAECGSNSTKADDYHSELSVSYICKITLTPVFQFMNVQKTPGGMKKLKKRTNMDHLRGLKHLSDTWANYHKANDNIDVILSCDGGKKVCAHKNILWARSELFCKLFDEMHKDLKKSQYKFKSRITLIVKVNNSTITVELETTDTDVNILNKLIKFLYDGKYKHKNFQEAKALFEMARVFGVKDLEKQCLSYIRLEISADIQFELYYFAVKHHCELLKRQVMNRVGREIIEHRMREEWRKQKWMTIFERYQKFFYQKVTKKMNEHMPIGVYNPNDHLAVHGNGNEVGNVDMENDNRVDNPVAENNNEVDNPVVENNNEVGNVVAENINEVGNMVAENINEVGNIVAENINEVGNIVAENINEVGNIVAENINEVSNMVAENNNEVGNMNEENVDILVVDNNNEVNNLVVGDNNEVVNAVAENKGIGNVVAESNNEVGSVSVANNNEVGGSNKNNIANECVQHDNGNIAASVNYYENFETFVIGYSEDSYLYATAYFDTRMNPEHFDDYSVTNNNDNATKDNDAKNDTKNSVNKGTSDAYGSNDNESVNENVDSNETIVSLDQTRGKRDNKSERFVSLSNETKSGTRGTNTKADGTNIGANSINSEANDTNNRANTPNVGTIATGSEAKSANTGTNSTNSGTNAANSGTNAAKSETNAAKSETNAAKSETNAAKSETNAAKSETNATDKEEIVPIKYYPDSIFNDNPHMRLILDDIKRIIDNTVVS